MATSITVEGTVGHCEQTVAEALREVSGVTDVTADRGVSVCRLGVSHLCPV